MTRLERRRWFQRYFWEIDRAGSTLAIRTGKRGELGELTHEQCADERAARERRELLKKMTHIEQHLYEIDRRLKRIERGDD